MFIANYELRLPGHITLDQRDSIIEHIRGYGAAEGDARSILIMVSSDSTQWALRGIVEQMVNDIESNNHGVEFHDRDEPEWMLTEDNT